MSSPRITNGASTAVQARRAVGTELRRLGSAIDGLDARAAARFGLTRNDLRCLDVLSLAGPLTPGELARAVGMSSGGLSLSLRRLERAHYVTRATDPADRRRVSVTQAARARALEEAVFGPLQAQVAELLSGYGPAELDLIHHFLTHVRAAVAASVTEKGA